MAESQPLEDWHRGYISGYEEGYQAGLEPETGSQEGVALDQQEEENRADR